MRNAELRVALLRKEALSDISDLTAFGELRVRGYWQSPPSGSSNNYKLFGILAVNGAGARLDGKDMKLKMKNRRSTQEPAQKRADARLGKATRMSVLGVRDFAAPQTETKQMRPYAQAL